MRDLLTKEAAAGASPEDPALDLGQLLDLLPGAVYVCDRDGLIVRYNRRAAELWGRAPRLHDESDRFCGAYRLHRPEGDPLPHAQCAMAEALQTGRSVRDQQVVIERPDGSRIVVLANVDPLRDPAGGIAGAVNCFRDVAEDRQEPHRQHRDHSHELLRLLPAAIYTTDADGRITFYNEAAAALWGCRPELGTAAFCGSWKLYWPDGRPLPHDACPMAIALREKRPVRGMEAVAERPDGTRVLFAAYPTPLFDETGRLTGAMNMLVEITERHRAEKDLGEQTRRLEALDRIAREIASNSDPERIVQTVTDAATELSGARFGAFFYNVADERSERYTLYCLSGAPRSAFDSFGLPRNTAIFEPTFRGERVIRSDDIRKDPRYGRSPPHYGMPKGHLPVVSYLAVPVVSRSGEVHGGLFFGHDRPGVFGAESERIVTSLAAHAAIAIDKAQLLRAAESALRQQREAEQAARHLAAIVESSDDAIISMNLDGIVTSWNRGAERLFEYRAEEIVGKPVTHLMPPDRIDDEPVILSRIRSGERVDHYETVRRRKDGSLVDISLTVSPVLDVEGRIIGASKIARDITERQRAQERQRLLLQEMSHRIKNLLTLAAGVVTLSARSARDPARIAAAAAERLQALARAHELILPDSIEDPGADNPSTTLEALIRTILAPYESDDEPERIVLEGPEVAIGGVAVTSLALLIQEFATNAAKYGALTSAAGRVKVRWTELGDELVMTWKERGGAELRGSPATEGFGSLLARATVSQLHGSISRDWRPEGLCILLSVPRDRLTA